MFRRCLLSRTPVILIRKLIGQTPPSFFASISSLALTPVSLILCCNTNDSTATRDVVPQQVRSRIGTIQNSIVIPEEGESPAFDFPKLQPCVPGPVRNVRFRQWLRQRLQIGFELLPRSLQFQIRLSQSLSLRVEGADLPTLESVLLIEQRGN